MPARSVAIVGTGLIGTSIGLALRAGGRSAPAVVGWDSSKIACTAALRKGGLTAIARSLDDAIARADVVIIAAPLDAAIAVLPRVIAGAKSGCLVMDVAGVKGPVVAAARRAMRKRQDVGFVSCHPMAGREHAGAAHAEAGLFNGGPFALVAPPQKGRALALDRAERFARRLGAKPLRMTAQAHDRLVAATSALPQLASIVLALAVDAASEGRTGTLSGPGYADATRLAASPYRIWGPALAANKPAVARALRQFERALRIVRDALERLDDRSMERLFFQAAAARRRGVAD
jgi:prephenate dehydrogenase